MNFFMRGILAESARQPACSVTLVNDFAVPFGYLPADVEGMTFAITNAASGIYLASQPLSDMVMPWTGKRWMQVYDILPGTGNTSVYAGIVGFVGGAPAVVIAAGISSAGGAFWRLESPVGVYVDGGLLNATDAPAVGCDPATGHAYVYDRLTGELPLNGMLPGAFAGCDSYLLVATIDVDDQGGSSPVTAAGTLRVTKFSDPLPGHDWCGNAA